jgi:DNA-binding CsgD family transcriptional regulator/tetratricopeptide (TPR) repeat protein
MFLELEPLRMTDAATQIRGFAGADFARIDVASVFERSEGNPFFIEQLVQSLLHGEAATGEHGLPKSLAAVLLARIEQVEGLSRDVLACLAVAGRAVTEEFIVQCCYASVSDVRAVLHDLARRHLLRDGTGRSRHLLAHALLAEAITASMLPGELREWHLRTAETLVRHSDSGASGAIAEHFRAAGREVDELPWRVAAAQYAGSIFSPSEAALHWVRALSLIESAPTSAALPDTTTLLEMYISGCYALKLAGELDTAIALAERAFERLNPASDLRTQARLLGSLGYFRGSRNIEAGRALLEQAVEIWDVLPPESASIDAAADLWMYSHPFQDSQNAVERLDRAMRDAARLRLAPRQQLALLERRAWADVAQGDVDSGMARFAAARGLLGIEEDPQDVLMYAIWYTDILLKLGRPEEVVAAAAPVSLLDWPTMGRREREGSSAVRANVFNALAQLGDPESASSYIDPVTDCAVTRDIWLAQAARATLDMLRGDLDASEERWKALPPINHVIAEWDFEPRRAELELWLRRPTRALEWVHQVLDSLGRSRDSRRAGQLLLMGARAFADVMEEANAGKPRTLEDDAAKIATTIEDLHAHMSDDPFVLGPLRPTGDADGLLWRAEIARAASSADPRAWQEVAEAYERYNRPHAAAYARWRQAECLIVDRRRRDQAPHALRKAARQATQHIPLLSAISRLAARARINLDEIPVQQTISRVPNAFGLTTRELTVLKMVARGDTNAQIGRELFISERTASVHVSNIIRKLQVHNRLQAAAAAEHAGLLRDDGPVNGTTASGVTVK